MRRDPKTSRGPGHVAAGPATAWTGRLLADRAQTWDWEPTVDLAELEAGLRP